MSTCNRSDLQTLGSQLVMPKNLPNHWIPIYKNSCIMTLLPSKIMLPDLAPFVLALGLERVIMI